MVHDGEDRTQAHTLPEFVNSRFLDPGPWPYSRRDCGQGWSTIRQVCALGHGDLSLREEHGALGLPAPDLCL